MYTRKGSLSVFDLCLFSYLSVLMEKYWVPLWKALFEVMHAGWHLKGQEKPSVPVHCLSLMTRTKKTVQILPIASEITACICPSLLHALRMFGVQVYRISISCHATSRRWLRMKVFFLNPSHECVVVTIESKSIVWS